MPDKQLGPKGPHKSRYGSAHVQSPSAQCDWSTIDAGLLLEVVEAVTAAGDCLMLSRTSDGGAMHVRILSEGVVEKWYPATTQELSEVLTAIVGALGGIDHTI